MRIFLLKDKLRNLNTFCYEDLTDITNKNANEVLCIDRKLNFSIDSNGKKHRNCFWEKMKESQIIEEKKYRQILESLLKTKVYRNPKPRENFVKSSDYWIKKTNESWDKKGIDGKSPNVIENNLGNACKRKQASNLVLNKRNTPHNINKLKKDIIYIFENSKKRYIKKIMLFDENDNLVLFLKRKKRAS